MDDLRRRLSDSMAPGRAYWWVVIIGLLSLTVPWMLSGGDVYVAASIVTTVLLTLSMVVVLGFGGYFSLGQGASFGIGTYTAAILMVHAHWDLAWCLIACLVVGGAAGVVMAITCLRTSELYLAMITLAYGFILSDVALNWTGVTGGGQGLTVAPTFFGQPLTGRTTYWLGAIFISIVIGVLSVLRGKHTGRTLAMVRESDVAAQSLGINTRLTMTVVFSAASAIAAVAGGLYVSSVGIADTTSFGFDQTVTTLTFVVVAGLRSTGALVVVASVLLYLQNEGSSASWANWLPFIYSVLVIVMLMIAPGGVSSLLRIAAAELTARRPGLRRTRVGHTSQEGAGR